MSNNSNHFGNLKEKRERDEKASAEKQQTIKLLNERFSQNRTEYEKIVAQVLEELKEAIDPSATITGPKELFFDLSFLYELACDMLSYDHRSELWKQYVRKASYLRGLGDQEYLEWQFTSQNKGFLFIYVGLINAQTIGFVCRNMKDLRYGELSGEKLVHELSSFFNLEDSYKLHLSEHDEVSISLSIDNWKAISRILNMYCQSLGQDWIEWEKYVNAHIKNAIASIPNVTSEKDKRQMTIEEMDAINDEIVQREAMDVYEEFEEYLDDD